MSSLPPFTAGPCPSCGSPASGKFCSNCGASLGGVTCAGCRAVLSPGARFCHRCGTPAGAPPPPNPLVPDAATAAAENRGFAAALPWAFAAIALLALIALVAGQRFGRSAQAGAAAAAAPAGDDGGGVADGPAGGMAPGRAPDISAMSPGERAERLYDRVMSLSERGRQDSVSLFAPMAIAAYEMLAPLDADQRYDLGRIGEVSGDVALARAEADSILATQPTHLLGLILAARAARLRGDQAAASTYLKKLAAVEPTERTTQRPEYLLHRNDITTALAEAKKR